MSNTQSNDIRQQEQDIKNYNAEEDALNVFFESFIKTGHVVLEEEIVPDLKIKVRPLNTGELLSAEAILKTGGGMPDDIVAKVRAASILSQAIISINEIDIESDESAPGINSMKRVQLYQTLLKMPPIVVHKGYKLYVKAVKMQNEKYEDMKGMFENSENF